jgi:hypothetical protein
MTPNRRSILSSLLGVLGASAAGAASSRASRPISKSSTRCEITEAASGPSHVSPESLPPVTQRDEQQG